jgi:hypothetical protein
MSARVSFLLNKMQADEEAKLITKEEMKKMQAQILSFQDKNTELTQKWNACGESNRVVTEALRNKQDELDTLLIKYEALQHKIADANHPHHHKMLANHYHHQRQHYQVPIIVVVATCQPMTRLAKQAADSSSSAEPLMEAYS